MPTQGYGKHDIAKIASEGVDALLVVARRLANDLAGEAHPNVRSGQINALRAVWETLFKVCGIGTTIILQGGPDSPLEKINRALLEIVGEAKEKQDS